MESHIGATEASRNFSEILNRVRYRGETFVIERGGEPVARLVPAGAPRCTLRDLVELLKRIPRPDDAYLDIVESVTRNQPPLPKSPWER